MFDKMKFLKQSIGVKLNFWFIVCLFFIFAIITTTNIMYQESTLLKTKRAAAEQLGTSILTAIRHPMMGGDQDIVQIMFDKYKELEGINAVHLLDWDGIIKRSTDRNLIGQKSMTEGLNKALEGESYAAIGMRSRTGSRVYTDLRPIMNEESCVQCHGEKHKVLGVLRMAIDWDTVDQAISATRNRNILISLIGLLFVAILVFILLKVMLTDPVNELINAASGLASRAGDLTQRLKVNGQDEVGRLADVFNRIIESMHDMVLRIRVTAEKVASSNQQLYGFTEEMNASTQEIASSIQQIAKGATVQSERVDETYKIMEKASVSLKEIMSNAQVATVGVEEASQKAETGRNTAQETMEKILRLTDTVTSTAEVIQSLGERSHQIGEITETITSIADQTNLLALNAAIEAARAGEAGRGFAVVAEEVRKLAEGSAQAVRKIGDLIKSIQSETDKAVGSIDISLQEVQQGKEMITSIAELLIAINKSVQSASKLTKQIAESTTEEVKGTERVVKAVNEVTSISKESVSISEEVSSNIEEQSASMQQMTTSVQELARLAVQLKDMVSEFKLKGNN